MACETLSSASESSPSKAWWRYFHASDVCGALAVLHIAFQHNAIESLSAADAPLSMSAFHSRTRTATLLRILDDISSFLIAPDRAP